jgi:hypothetical protein
MALQDAIRTAQEALPSLGAEGVVIDVRREGRDVLVVLDDYRTVKVGGFLAVKLGKMLRSDYLRWRRSSA